MLRGFTNSLLLERDDLAAGTSGGCHSALHGGARYAVSDIQTARECLQENQVYRKIVPQVVDPTDAIWVAKTDEQMEFAEKWMKNADDIGLPYEIISVEEATSEEPLLTKDIRFAPLIQDSTRSGCVSHRHMTQRRKVPLSAHITK